MELLQGRLIQRHSRKLSEWLGVAVNYGYPLSSYGGESYHLPSGHYRLIQNHKLTGLYTLKSLIVQTTKIELRYEADLAEARQYSFNLKLKDYGPRKPNG